MRGTLDLLEEAGMAAVREKSKLLTAFAVDFMTPGWNRPGCGSAPRGTRSSAAATSP